MSIVLRNQIESAERSADEILRRDHQDAMFCRDVEDVVRVDLWLFEEVARHVEGWQNSIGSARSSTVAATTQDLWFELYVRLELGFRKTAKLIQAVEALQHEVEGKPAFMKVWRELRGITCFDPARVRQSAEQFESGRYRVLTSAANGA